MCLIDLIGLRDCAGAVPTSGKYINDLPAISTELAQKISDKEQASFAGLWSNIQNLAVTRFGSDFLAAISESADFKGTIFKSSNLRLSSSGTVLPTGVASYKGNTITLPSNKAVKVEVKHLEFYSNTAVLGADIVIYELLDQSIYYQTTADVVIGKNSIVINQTIDPAYENSRIFIGLDCEAIELRQDQSNASNSAYYCDDCDDNSDYFSYNASWVDKATFERSDQGQGSGVNAVVSVYCDIGAIICDNQTDISEAFRYLLAVLMLIEKQQSKNANIFTYFDPKATEGLILAYSEQYERELMQSVERIDIKEYCFSCNDYGQISDGYLIP